MQEEEKEKIRCKNCDSTQTYIRLKTNERCCRVCGHVQKIEEEEE